jgi:TfoX/Sxy family transcriptional regulator of competence genes
MSDGPDSAAEHEADPRALKARLDEVADGLPFEVTTRAMMGGTIGSADGAVFVSLSRGGFGIKLAGEDHAALLARPGARRQRHGAGEPESKTYVILPPDDLADDAVLLHWLERAGTAAKAARGASGRRQ